MLIKKNLQKFWSVQRCSGVNPTLFTSYSEAELQYDKWVEKMLPEFKKWKSGDTSANVMVESSFEIDPREGSVMVWSINDACLPGGIYSYEPFTEKLHNWSHCEGYEKIKWGFPSIARLHR